jgi:hypothetical protein
MELGIGVSVVVVAIAGISECTTRLGCRECCIPPAKECVIGPGVEHIPTME